MNRQVQQTKMARNTKNFTASVLSTWIMNDDINKIRSNMDRILKSDLLNNPDIRTLIRMRIPDDDEEDPDNLRDFYENLL
jgi:phage pi2 protein 07